MIPTIMSAGKPMSDLTGLINITKYLINKGPQKHRIRFIIQGMEFSRLYLFMVTV